MPPSSSPTPAEYLRLVGKRVAADRRHWNMPADVLARVAGLTVGQLLAFEAGEFDPSISAVQGMAECLGTTIVDLLAVSRR